MTPPIARLLKKSNGSFGGETGSREFGDLTGLTRNSGTESDMANINVILADGQVWRMAELNLKVGMVGKLLVHYKLAKPNAVRVPNLVGSIATIQKFLKKNKAVLVGNTVEAFDSKKTSGVQKPPANGKASIAAKAKR